MINFDEDILKHYVRTKGWLPACQRRLTRLRSGRKAREQRRLRYFTFCAVGAVDVLMLDVAQIVRQSTNNRFDTVCFFDKSREDVVETQRRIPGAIGFPGDFVTTVLLNDPEEALLAESADSLAPLEHDADERRNRELQVRLGERRDFLKQFPFDVINLDLEEYLFKSSQAMPGRVVSALRKILGWQRYPLKRKGFPAERLAEFTLMFTTQVGPREMGSDYLAMLTRRIDDNLAADNALRQSLVERTGASDGAALLGSDFAMFFEFAVPKVLMHTLIEEDWHVDEAHGLKIFEFERDSEAGPYKMLHFVMDVIRNNPPKENRAPGDDCEAAMVAYRAVAHQVFRELPIPVRLADIDAGELIPTLDQIKARRRKYCPEDAPGIVDNV
jgi:hypothetical protein